MTVGYVESPVGLLTEVGWGAGEGLMWTKTRSSTTSPTASMYGVQDSNCNFGNVVTLPGVPTNTLSWMRFLIVDSYSGWREGKTAADVLGIEWSDSDAGASFQASAITPTQTCTDATGPPLTGPVYTSGGSLTLAGVTGYANMTLIVITATSYTIHYQTNSAFSGYDEGDYTLWTAGTFVNVKWP